MSCRRLIVQGKVQGVGFREWTRREAAPLGLSGWVRNIADGSVEMLLDGEADAIQELARLCRRGPRAAVVSAVIEHQAEPVEQAGFTVLPDG